MGIFPTDSSEQQEQKSPNRNFQLDFYALVNRKKKKDRFSFTFVSDIQQLGSFPESA